MTEFPPLPQSMRQDIRALHKRTHRDSERRFILEGDKIVREALASGLDVQDVVLHPESSAAAIELAQQCAGRGAAVYLTPQRHFASLCDTTTPQSIVAVAGYPETQPDFGAPLVILDAVADPGNVGTIIRTAEWFGYSNVLLGPGCADRFNPKTLRSTMGSAFRVAVAASTSLEEDIRRHLTGAALYGATLEATTLLSDLAPPLRHAVVLGSESHGISAGVRALLTEEFLIPGRGRAESLNVAIAAGISLYHCSTALRG